jgi:hypothetical protein
LGVLLGDGDVVLGALAVDQSDLYDVALVHHEVGIDLAVDLAALADIDHLAAGDAGAQGVAGVGHAVTAAHGVGECGQSGAQGQQCRQGETALQNGSQGGHASRL